MFRLNEKIENDVDDHPTPIVELVEAREYALSLSNFGVEHSLKFSTILDVMNMQFFRNILNKISISNINKHHQKTILSYFHSV